MPSIAVYTDNSESKAAAAALALRLNLPLVTEAQDFEYLLHYNDQQLSLSKTGDKSLPLSVDFLSGKMTYRRQHASIRRETLARALGLKHKITPSIVDATAGLGRDSFILACLGFEVTLLERSPLIHALLEDGIKRALAHSKSSAIAERMHLIHTDATSWMQTQKPNLRPNIIYLDPMFPERQKSALVKKDMRLFHGILGEDLDADQLLRIALTCATLRVVVKRPRLATYLADIKPSYSLEGSSSRFDIYLI